MKNTIPFITFLFLLLLSCTKQLSRLEQALKLAGENRFELERVLAHYSENPSDSLKYRATVYLIENMTGFYSVSPEWEKELSLVYNKHVEISEKHNWAVGKEWGVEIDSLKDANKILYNKMSFSNVLFDIETMKADWLINNIELAFKAWTENIYTQNFSFDFFCEYILPYRFQSGFLLDDSRNCFYDRHSELFKNSYSTITEFADSLLIQYKDLYFNYYYGASIPIHSIKTLELIKRSTCEERSWFNSTLFSSLGMAVSTDFVPARGNRNNSHTWNVLIMEDKIYPFDPFWIEDRWNYTEIYNNIAIDEAWGKFRLPKVYRNTYAIQQSGPLFDHSVDRGDIPPLFFNSRMKDVSHEYFDTTDVFIPLTNLNEDHKYAYICVYGYRSWIPVQWGRISEGQAGFRGMGRDIIYIVAYYQKGVIIPASDPFLLNKEGDIHYIRSNKDTDNLYIHSIGCFQEKEDKIRTLQSHDGSIILGLNKEKNIKDTLCILTKKCSVWENLIYLDNRSSYDQIDICLPTDTVSFCELVFYTQKDNKLIRIPNVKLATALATFNQDEYPAMIYDNLSATGFNGKIVQNNSMNKLSFELDKDYDIELINYIPYTKSMMWKGSIYKLYYWDGEWVYHSMCNGNNGVLDFKSVPMGTLYRIETEEVKSQKNMERIFLYKDGIVQWM